MASTSKEVQNGWSIYLVQGVAISQGFDLARATKFLMSTSKMWATLP
jgi:hypothetical protein